MNFRNALSLGTAALALAAAAPARAQLFNGGFEAPLLGASPFSTNLISNWGGSPSYGVSQNVVGGFQATGGAAEGTQYAYMQGVASAISQTVNFAVAGNYTLTWSDAGRTGGAGFGGNTTYALLVGGVPLSSFTTITGQGFSTKSASFAIVTPGLIQVRYDVSTSVGDNTALIDNVILAGPSVSAPEPGSLALLALATPGIALFVRRRRKA